MRLILLFLLFTKFLSACDDPKIIEVTQLCQWQFGDNTWFSFTSDIDRTVSIITAGNDDGQMELFKGPCGQEEFLQFDDNSGPFLMPQIYLEAQAGIQYLVHVTNVELFEICIYDCGPLPVELISFTAKRDGTLINLEWAVASEINNNYFTIYRSTDLENWEEIGRVIGAGNSSLLKYYTYAHKEMDDKTLYYYKLTQTDFNGDTAQLEILPLVQGTRKNKQLIKELTIDGRPVPEGFIGIRLKVYDDGTIGKEFMTK